MGGGWGGWVMGGWWVGGRVFEIIKECAACKSLDKRQNPFKSDLGRLNMKKCLFMASVAKHRKSASKSKLSVKRP